MSTVRPGVAVNGYTEEGKKKNKIINYLFIYYVYIPVWVVEFLGVAELGGALGTEVMEEVLVLFGKL